MKTIGNYSIKEKIKDTRHSMIYRANRIEDGEPVVIKLMRSHSPSSSDIARFKQEYEIIKDLDIEGIIKTYDLINYEDSIALVLEDFNALSLQECLDNQELSTETFLDIALRLSETLGKLHKSGVIHKDIKPANILIGKEWSKCKITDFGISHLITHEHEEIYNPEVISGTLLYMAPEQTGRINRAIDYRTDLYALGITFYQLLTGTTPFYSQDPMEIIHSHIARQPVPPRDINPEIPRPLSDLVMKLLSKMAEERYQSAFGVMADLQYCKEQLSNNGAIDNFLLATKDISLKFNIPYKLIGRETEISRLMEGFECMMEQGKPVTTVVTGQPGVGKSALINEIYKPVTASRGYFITGKYEQFRRDVPYNAMIQAFKGLISQLLAEPREHSEAWKIKIQEVLGSSGKVITEVIPTLEYIIGPQPEIPELDPEAARNRFNHVFINFIKVFTEHSHPLVLFLDDLQWADTASLLFLEKLLSNMEKGHLWLLLAYRNNEVEESHPLVRTLYQLETSEMEIKKLDLQPLSREKVNNLIADFLRLEEEAVSSLTELVYSKTRGNPFFVNQFLKNLYHKNLLELDPVKGWIWYEDKIQNLHVTDNVVELMSGKIFEFPEPTREALKAGACMGNRFDLETVSVIMDKPIEPILQDLNPALDDGLIYFDKDMCYFLHDRIQEAAYSQMDEKDKKKTHYRIGRYIYNCTPKEELSQKIFYIVNQINTGREEIEETKEEFKLEELARLNLIAGEKARDSAAFSSSLEYLVTGISLLNPESCWQQHYDLALKLYTEAARAAYLNGDFSNMDHYIRVVTKNAVSQLDCIDVYEVQIQGYHFQGRLQEAANHTFNVLDSLGIKHPRKISGARIAWELHLTQKALQGKSNQNILELPKMKDPYHIAAIRIATNAVFALYVGGYTREVTTLTLKMVRLSINSGLNVHTPYWLACYTVVLFSMSRLQEAFRFGDLALQLKKQLQAEEIKTDYMVNAMTLHWRDHLRIPYKKLEEVYYQGFELGDLEHAAYSAVQLTLQGFASGKDLNHLYEEIDSYYQVFIKYNQQVPSNYALMLLQVIYNLTTGPEEPQVLNGPRYHEEEMIPLHQKYNDMAGLAITYIYKQMVCYIFGKTPEAAKNEKLARRYLNSISGLYPFSLYYFYRTLNKLRIINSFPPRQKKEEWKKIERSQKKLRLWAKHGPQNHQHKSDLVEAEIQKSQSNYLQAEDLYHNSISGAQKNGFLQDEALACELTALYYWERNLHDLAAFYISRASRCYSRWGASSKVEQLKENWNEIMDGQELTSWDTEGPGLSTLFSVSTISNPGESYLKLDMTTVIKSLQAVSGEIAMDSLLSSLMQIGIENAGAERGIIFIEEEGELYVEAESDTHNSVRVLQPTPFDSYHNLPTNIVSYVYKTMENVILDDATSDERFASDPYIRDNNIKSVLCAPIRRKNEMSGVVYLENNLSTGVFTPERLALLQVLSSQAAISIENAKLFEMARRDGLTGLINHRYFHYCLEKEIKNAWTSRHVVTLLMLDIDHFKSVNDTYGHQAGDTVLKELAKILIHQVPDKNLVCRYGGEEFTIIIPGFSPPEAKEIAESIRKEVENKTIYHENQRLNITISIGLTATRLNQAIEPTELIRQADRALYTAKETGRNRVEIYR